MVIDYRK